jgi:DNA repair protein RadD
MKLRPYQKEAHDAIVSWVRQSREPCLIEAATGAGKSLIIAKLAETINTVSNGKHVLCICPSAELVEQNAEKFETMVGRCSVFSASAGKVSLRFPVVFGTPGTVKNKLSRFSDKFGMIVIDEAHGTTPTIKKIIDTIREKNQNVRVVGLTATPYRLGTGYIYKMDEHDKVVPEHQTKDPYFTKLVYRITARKLLDMGFLSPVEVGQIGTGGYETRGLELNRQGKFSASDVDRAYHGHGRKTSQICADLVAQSAARMGVLIYAATVQHAHEVMASMPPEITRLITGETPKDERAKIIRDFKARKIKYIVNVSVLTTGFDAPHVDVVAMLRLTESASLLQQIIGRGMRLHDEKDHCLFLDYAENVDRHFPDGDIFTPDIRVGFKSDESVDVNCVCPKCNGENIFKARKNPDQYEIDENGYFVDLSGHQIQSEFGPIPGHSGRRCQVLHRSDNGDYLQCGYRWTFKECGACDAENDIAARYCTECKAELVDPNEKLRIDFKALKRDPTKRQTDKVLDWTVTKTVARSGKDQWKVDWTTPYRRFTTWTPAEPTNDYQWRENRKIMDGTQGLKVMPETVTYVKEESGFFKVLAFNRAADVDPTEGMVLL